MKKFFILFAILITLWFFLPFIDKYSLFQIHDLIKNQSYIDIDTSKILKSVLIFIISSWFISLWYSKRVKISIIGLIWAIVYLFYYYKIFWVIFDSKDNIQKWFEYWNMLIWKENTIDIILKIISESKNHLWIWFYMILWWFILNSFAIINIFKNLILLSSWNYKPKEKDDIEEKTSNNFYFESIINKFKDKNIKEILVKYFPLLLIIIWILLSIFQPFELANRLTWLPYSNFMELFSINKQSFNWWIIFLIIIVLNILLIPILINYIKPWFIKQITKFEKYHNNILLIIPIISGILLNIVWDYILIWWLFILIWWQLLNKNLKEIINFSKKTLINLIIWFIIFILVVNIAWFNIFSYSIIIFTIILNMNTKVFYKAILIIISICILWFLLNFVIL